MRDRFLKFPELKRYQSRAPDPDEQEILDQLPGVDLEYETMEIITSCPGLTLPLWDTFDTITQGRYRAYWREKKLRDGLLNHLQRKQMEKKSKQRPGKPPGNSFANKMRP